MYVDLNLDGVVHLLDDMPMLLSIFKITMSVLCLIFARFDALISSKKSFICSMSFMSST